jgi:hypothetical protein
MAEGVKQYTEHDVAVILTRYNVRSKFVDGPADWEYEAHDKGQFLFADTALDYIAALEAENRELRAAAASLLRLVTDEQLEEVGIPPEIDLIRRMRLDALASRTPKEPECSGN